MNRLVGITCAVIVIVVSAMGWAINHYRDNAIDFKQQRDEATHSLKLANDTISDMKLRQRDAAELDAKYTGELADAQETIDQLERDVAAGRKRLQVNARFTSNGETGTGSLGDASTARLTDTAQRDYFTLREQIATVTKQIEYLQGYIKTQCQK